MMAEIPESAAPVEEASPRTVMLFDPFHGFQIVFFESAQKSWLWYPGNGQSLPADVRQNSEQLCFKYGHKTYNSVTGRGGGEWSCTPRFLHDGLIVASVRGDVFDLRGGRVPYVRDKCDGTQRLGRGSVDPGLFRQGCRGG